MDDDKEKSIIDKVVDSVTNAVGNMTKSTVAPPEDPEQVVEHANDQMLIEDGEVTAPKRPPRRRIDPTFRANKRVAAAEKRAAPAKKAAKKSAAKKSAKKAPKKTAVKKAKKAPKKRRRKASKRGAKKKAKRG